MPYSKKVVSWLQTQFSHMKYFKTTVISLSIFNFRGYKEASSFENADLIKNLLRMQEIIVPLYSFFFQSYLLRHFWKKLWEIYEFMGLKIFVLDCSYSLYWRMISECVFIHLCVLLILNVSSGICKIIRINTLSASTICRLSIYYYYSNSTNMSIFSFLLIFFGRLFFFSLFSWLKYVF